MALYTFHELTLEVENEEQASESDLARLLEELSWVRASNAVKPPALRLRVRLHDEVLCVPSRSRLAFEAEGFHGFESGEEFYLTDGSSCLHLQPMRGQGTAQLASGFFAKSQVLQHNFWAFGLLKLLRPLGLYSLHAAGVVAANGVGVLIIGASGSGKSTLTLGLIQEGWGYLSDDAVLLRQQPEGIAAVACRKSVYIDDGTAARYADLPLRGEVFDPCGECKRRVHLEAAYPGLQVAAAIPHVLLFSRIVPDAHSALRPMDAPRAFKHLLAQSGPQLFDRHTMAQHLELLTQLMHQAASYELSAGRDLYQWPGTLAPLLTEATGEARWHAS
jgi:hypothetical protein